MTPGHPEYGRTTGVETTTGPLGQGCGNSVGMAIASHWLAARYNRPSATLFDFDVYTFCSDGDLMEGVASEAASLAGHLRLSNLCWIYDNNTVTIEGHTDLAFSEDVATRFKAYRWNVVRLQDANDTAGFARAVEIFRATKDRPTLIIVDSIIGYGAPHKQNTAAAHSDALGAEEVKLAKRFYGWPEDAQFLVPDGVYESFRDGIGRRGRALRDDWSKTFSAYKSLDAQAAREVETLLQGKLPEQWDRELPNFPAEEKGPATRDASGKVLDAIAKTVPWLMGGAGDLAPSTKTAFPGAKALEADDPGGRVMHFGVREHAMGAIVNGLVLSKLRAFGATFLTFSDYMRPAIRLAALMEIPVFHVFTHDSIGLGEDGPTHQPIEQLVALRAIPNIVVLRPADANEVREAYKVIMALTDRPACLVLRPPEASDFRPQPLRRRGRPCPRRLCDGGLGQPASDPDWERQRSAALYFGLRSAQTGGNCWAGREHAKLGAVRTAGSALSRGDPSAERQSPRHGRSRRRDRLGPLCRSRRDDHRYAFIRRLGARDCRDAEIRICCRASITGRQGSDCQAPLKLEGRLRNESGESIARSSPGGLA